MYTYINTSPSSCLTNIFTEDENPFNLRNKTPFEAPNTKAVYNDTKRYCEKHMGPGPKPQVKIYRSLSEFIGEIITSKPNVY